MKRRKFIRKTALGLGGMMVMTNVSASSNIEQAEPVLVSLKGAMPQIRHGALNLPQLGLANFEGQNSVIPFEWLGEIRRNLFFKNGFQKSETEDIEIISVIYEDVQEEQTEAIQIQLSDEETTVLIGEEWSSLKKEVGIKCFERSEVDSLSLYIGHLNLETEYSKTFNSNSEIFVHVLDEQLTANGQELFADFGLALNGIQDLVFTCAEQSKMLIFEKKIKKKFNFLTI